MWWSTIFDTVKEERRERERERMKIFLELNKGKKWTDKRLDLREISLRIYVLIETEREL